MEDDLEGFGGGWSDSGSSCGFGDGGWGDFDGEGPLNEDKPNHELSPEAQRLVDEYKNGLK